MDALLLVILGLAGLVALCYLFVQIIRLRLELWANQRVIAALEQAGHKPPAKKSRLPEMLVAALLLLLVSQLLLLLLQPFV